MREKKYVKERMIITTSKNFVNERPCKNWPIYSFQAPPSTYHVQANFFLQVWVQVELQSFQVYGHMSGNMCECVYVCVCVCVFVNVSVCA